MSKRPRHSRNALRPQATSAWEWVIAIVGALLVVSTLSYLIYFEASTSSRPPQVTIDWPVIMRSGDKYLVSFIARNQSSATAAGLRIRGELRQDGRIVESSELSFDYLPGFSDRQGYFYFEQDPSVGELHVFPLSYVEP
jgi:uncharacterized protein (TIGR02588 family)